MVFALWLVLAVTPFEEAKALEANGNDRAAIKVLDAAVKAEPSWPIGRLELGRLLLKVGQSEAAYAQLDIARTLSAENPRAHYLFALAAADSGREADARRALEVAVALRPDFADAQLKLASVLIAQNDPSAAVKLLASYLGVHPEANGARFQYAEALERTGSIKAAEHELRTLLQQPALKQLAGRRLIALLETNNRHADAEKVQHQIDPPKKRLRDLPPSRH